MGGNPLKGSWEELQVCAHVYWYVHMCTGMFICVLVCKFVYYACNSYVHMCIMHVVYCIKDLFCLIICVHVYVHVYVCQFVCMYMYMHMYVNFMGTVCTRWSEFLCLCMCIHAHTHKIYARYNSCSIKPHQVVSLKCQ
jgi:hypothetical protein